MEVGSDETQASLQVYYSGWEGSDRRADSLLYVLLHGGGHSAQSWALAGRVLSGHARVAAIDFRGHGDSTAISKDSDGKLSKDTLVSDVVEVLKYLDAKSKSMAATASSTTPSSSSLDDVDVSDGTATTGSNETDKSSVTSSGSSSVALGGGKIRRPVLGAGGYMILAGHSMGGAIAGHVGACGLVDKLLAGVAVLDVVEGTALAALPGMNAVVSSRPSSFPSLTKAVSWAVKAGMLKNVSSARVSIPPQLVPLERDGRGDVTKYGWRTDLMATSPFWMGWFQDLSTAFLAAPCAKILILAGTDTLDKPLTVAHMQGKFKLVVLPAVGHVVQEDDPESTATALLSFANRFHLI